MTATTNDWKVLDLTAEEFMIHMASLGTPVEIQLVGVFAEPDNTDVRTAHRDVPLPPHKDGIYTQAIADMQGGKYVVGMDPPDIVGMFCIQENGLDEPCTTVFYEDEAGENVLGEVTLRARQAVIWRNNLWHGRKGPVGERLLIRFWVREGEALIPNVAPHGDD